MHADEHRQHQGRTAHNAVVAGIGRTDGHTLRHIVQRNGAGHDHTGHKQAQLAVLAGIMLLQMVAVDQLIQIIGGFGMVFVDVRHLDVGLSVNKIVQKEGNTHTQCHREGDPEQTRLGLDGLHDQIEAHHTQHHAAGKAQQQADRAVRIFLQQRTDQTTQARTRHAGQKGCQDQSL